MTLRRAVLLVPDAREALGNKKYVKAHTLSKKMKISPSLAGQILKVMDESGVNTRTAGQRRRG